jgi:hypothetical protein
MNDIAYKLKQQTEAARLLKQSIAEIIGNDEEALHDAIEGETNLLETIEAGVERIATLKCHMEAIGAQKKRLDERCARFERQYDLLRTAVLTAMQQAGEKKVELAAATVTCKKVPAKVEFTAEADVPAEYWKPSDPKLDKKAVLAALKDGTPVPGATLAPETITLDVRLG